MKKNVEIEKLSSEKPELLLKLDKEEREAVNAKLAHVSICNEVNDCEYEIDFFNMKINKPKDATVLYERSLDAKKSREIEEINKALVASKRVFNYVSSVRKELQSSKNRGSL